MFHGAQQCSGTFSGHFLVYSGMALARALCRVLDLQHTWGEQRLIVVGRSTEDTKRSIEAGCGQIANSAKDKASANIAYSKVITDRRIGEPPDCDVGIVTAKAIKVGPFDREELFAYYKVFSKVSFGETLHGSLD